MTPEDARHGTRAGYHAHRKSQQRPCAPCHQAHRRYCKRYDLRVIEGERPRIGTARARRHIESLIDAGLTSASIARAADVADSSIYRIRVGQATMTPQMARRILAVSTKVADSTPGIVPVIGSRRRLHAMMVNGWSLSEIARRTGVERRTLHWISNGRRPGVLGANARAIREFFDTVWDQPRVATSGHDQSSITRTLRLAAKRRYLSAMAWDDIDNPVARIASVDTERHHDRVDPVVVQRILAGDWRLKATRAEKEAVTARWTGKGGSLNELEALTGWRAHRYVEDGAA